MASKREQVLQALHLVLQNVTGVTLLRNEVLPTGIPSAGLIILRDGSQGAPDVTLNPVLYSWQHRAEIEVYASLPEASARTALVDQILAAVSAALNADRTLAGAVDMLEINPPEMADEAVEGAPAIRYANFTVTLFYDSTDPLN